MPDARDVLARLLRIEGFKAVTAGDGVEALATVKADAPLLSVLDLTIPRMDGVSVLRVLRQDSRWRALPVILFTGVTEGCLGDEAIRLGCRTASSKEASRAQN